MISSAKEVILVADSTKFNRIAFARVAPLNILHQIVTDKPLEAKYAEAFAQLNISVHISDQIDNPQLESKSERE